MYANSVDGAKRTMKSHLALLEPYLKAETDAHFQKYSHDDSIRSRAMLESAQQIRFEDWLAPSGQDRSPYPTVSRVDAPAPPGWLQSRITASGLMREAWLITGLAAILAATILAPILLLTWVRPCQWKLKNPAEQTGRPTTGDTTSGTAV